MPQRIEKAFVSICSRCGHKWRPRRGKPLRCAKCKSPAWDRPVPGKRTRGIVQPPDLESAAAPAGALVSPEQACDILRTWQANRSWVGMDIRDKLASMHVGAWLRTLIGRDWLELSDEPGLSGIVLKLEPKATYKYCLTGNEAENFPYEILNLQFGESRISLGAFRTRPQEPGWLVR